MVSKREMGVITQVALKHTTHIFFSSYCDTLWINMGFSAYFFFFYWHYNRLWVLAFSVILFHSLSSHCVLHRLIPIICMSSLSAIRLFVGLPLILVPICFHSNILLGALSSSIRITWPIEAILLFINLTTRSVLVGWVHNSFWFSRIHTSNYNCDSAHIYGDKK
jgi:hypothetical protein